MPAGSYLRMTRALLARRRRSRRSLSLLEQLRRWDDDPVLLCGCADAGGGADTAGHTC